MTEADRTFKYRGKEHPIMDMENAEEEREKRVEAGGENICIIACLVYGGSVGDYIVVSVRREDV